MKQETICGAVCSVVKSTSGIHCKWMVCNDTIEPWLMHSSLGSCRLALHVWAHCYHGELFIPLSLSLRVIMPSQ